MKKTIIAVILFSSAMTSMAQSGTNSPYSQYGLGELAEPASSFNRGMNGLSYGLREHNQVNYMNPASYSAVDSLSFIFDAGVSIQLTNFNEGGTKVNAKNANFEYAVAAFRVAKHLVLSFGIIPYTNIGYNYSNTERVNEFVSMNAVSSTYTNTYNGSGGLHQVYLGAGWEPFRGFSFGMNASYLWGDYTRSIVNSYSESYVNTMSRQYTATINSYKLDFGLQYAARLSKKDEVTLGLTYGIGHKLGADPSCMIISTNSQTAVSDTTEYKVDNGLSIPSVFGVGLAWQHSQQLKLGVDYQLQKWSSVDYPQYSNDGASQPYHLLSNQFSDRHKITLGGEYCNNERSRNFFNRVHYRAGVSYASPYLKINGNDGPKELSVSAGFGIPIINTWNNRSMLNISAQWVNRNSDIFVKENSFRINIGFTFNERWFSKFKVE